MCDFVNLILHFIAEPPKNFYLIVDFLIISNSNHFKDFVFHFCFNFKEDVSFQFNFIIFRFNFHDFEFFIKV